MTEENIITETKEEALSVPERAEEEVPSEASEEEKKPNEDSEAGEKELAQEEENSAEGETEEQRDADISAEEFARTLGNPMFAVFARGRKGDINSAVRDFNEMMQAGRALLSEEAKMKMTPGGGFAGGGVALSERQRKIAREAGMSYREYYELIHTLPEKNNK